MKYFLLLNIFLFSVATQATFAKGNHIAIEEDTDGDGIPDKKDACPDEPGLKENKGCPEGITPPAKEFRYDRDKDGILNDVDKCPDVAGVEEENGCPIDPQKAIHKIETKTKVKELTLDAPQTPKKFEMQVQPIEANANQPMRDADHDGVKNWEDKCPFSPGTFALKGCPELSVSAQEILTSVTDDVKFETIKSDLMTKSKEALEALAVMLTVPYPAADVRISVYADEYGGHHDNVNLTLERGKAIEKYLIEKGVDKNRLRFQYFGDLRPPKSGWSMNERSRVIVELIFP